MANWWEDDSLYAPVSARPRAAPAQAPTRPGDHWWNDDSLYQAPDFSNVESSAQSRQYRSLPGGDVPRVELIDPSASTTPAEVPPQDTSFLGLLRQGVSDVNGQSNRLYDAAENASIASGLATTAAFEDTRRLANLAGAGVSILAGENPDSWFENVQDAGTRARRSREVAQDLSMPGAVAGEVAGVLPMLGLGRAAPVAETVATGLQRATRAILDGLAPATAIAEQQSAALAADAVDAGATGEEAQRLFAAGVPINTAANLIPVSAPGRLATRAVTGAGLGAGANVAADYALHEVSPNYTPGVTAESATVGGALGGIMAAGFGARAPTAAQQAGRLVDQVERSANRVHTPETAAIDEGRAAASQIFAEAGVDATPAVPRTPAPAPAPAPVPIREAVPRPQQASLPANAARAAELEAKPELNLFEREELELLRQPQVMRSLREAPSTEGIEVAELPADTVRPAPARDPVVEGYQALARNPEFFRTQPLQGRSMPELARESGTAYTGRSEENGVPFHSVAIEQPNGRTYEARVYDDGRDVWLDASRLESGSGAGDRAYNLAYSYARNNGRSFIEDPAGLSDSAMYRRPVQQASAMLKSGDARTIEPGDYLATQRPGGPETRPVARTSRFEPAVRENLTATADNTARAVPEIEDVRFDPQQRDFVSRLTGERVDDAAFDEMAAMRRQQPVPESMVRIGDERAPAPVGRNTLKQAALTNTLRDASPQDRQAIVDALGEMADSDLGPLGRVMPSKRRPDPQTDTPEFKRWFGGSKVVSPDGAPLTVYHGSTADFNEFSVGELGKTTGANSAKQGFFFTNDPNVASGYATIGDWRKPDFHIYDGPTVSIRDVEKLKAVADSPGPGIFDNPVTGKRERIAINRSENSESLRRILHGMRGGKSFDQAITSPDEFFPNGTAELFGGKLFYNEGTRGDTLYPTYLSIKNPLVHDFVGSEFRDRSYSDLLKKAIADGHDGVIFRNTYDDAVRGNTKAHDVFVVFRPEQIKSAIGNTGTFDPSNPDIRYSKQGEKSATAVEKKKSAEDAVAGFWGRGAVNRLKNRARVEFVTKQEVIDQKLGGHHSESQLDRVDGFFDPATGKAYIVADSGADPKSMPGVLSHEILHANAEQFLGTEGMKRLKSSVARLRNREGDIQKAYAKVPKDTPTKHVDEEALAYLAQDAPSHRFSKMLADETKLFLNRMGVPLDWLNANGAAVRKVAALNLMDAGSRDSVRSFIGSARPDVLRSDGGKRSDDARNDDRSLPSRDALPKFNRATEFWERNVGAPVFNGISRAVKAVIANDFLKARQANLAEDMPDAAKKAWRQYKIEVGSLQKTVSEIGDEAKNLTPSERQMVSDLIEGEMKAGVTPPENVVRMATLMTSIMRKQSDELARLGMLSQDAKDRWDGRYLPRFYAKNILSTPFDQALRRLYLQGIKGSHLRGRGLFEDVQVKDVPKYENLGWEVRDKEDRSKLTPDDSIRMWRDFTPEERRKMGEVRDAMYRFARGYTETQVDLAKGRLFEHIANSNIARDDNPGALYVQVPDTSVPGTGVKKFGSLAGKYVPGDVLSALRVKAGPDSEFMRAYLKGLSLWKEGKTSLNPVTHVNNVVSNVVMADLAGVNLLDPRSYRLYANTIRDYRQKSGAYDEARKAGLFGGEWYGNEVGQWLPMPGELADAKADQTIAGKFASKIVDGIGKGRRFMGDAYQGEDQFFKLLLFKQARERGLGPDDAVNWAERFVFDYSTAAPGVTKLKNYALPFANYTFKAIPALTFAMTHYPWRVAKWIGLLGGFGMYSFDKLYGEDAEEMKDAEGQLLPEYMRGQSSFFGVPKAVRLPYNTEEGDGMYIDISRFLPMGDLFDANNQLGGVPLLQPFTPNNPVLTTAYAMLANRDSFTGKDVVLGTDTAGEAAQKRLGWLYRQMAPNNPLVPGSYNFNRLAEASAAIAGEPIGPYTGLDYNGNTISPGRAIAQTFGVKLRPVDFEREQGWQMSDLRRDLQDLKSQRTKLRRNQSISDSTKEAQEEKIEAKIEAVQRRIDELSDVPTP